MQNTLGQKFSVTLTGSSHGEFVGGIIRNCPAGLTVDTDFIKKEIDRRRPEKFGTLRKEADEPEFLSGITDGITDGKDIEFYIKNKDVRKKDYENFRNFFRPSHADYTYYTKFSDDDLKYKDFASARMFLPIVVAGSFAKIFLKEKGVCIQSEVIRIGHIDWLNNRKEALKLLDEVLNNGDTLGGMIKCVISGIKAGIGEPVFDKLSANLAKNIMSIPSAVSFSLGDVLNRDTLKGSEDIDNWNGNNTALKGGFTTLTNHSGGINAGITNGMPVIFFAGFHPVHTLAREMTLISNKGELITRKIKGRHDTCALLRTPVIVESVSAITLMDYMI